MRKENTLAYKVCEMTGIGPISCMNPGNSPRRRVLYKIGKFVTARLGASKALFTFANKKAAKLYMAEYASNSCRLFRCEVKGTATLPRNFYDHANGIPEGTLLVTHVKLLRKVPHKEAPHA